MSADIAAPTNFAEINRDALGVDPKLHLVATYVRAVEAGIARVWENVFDWEHFPALHAEYFSDVRLLEEHARGWRVAVTRQPGRPDRRIVIELDADRERSRYCVRILEGDGAGTEIWTLLAARDADRTAVEVRFYLPPTDPQKLAELGEAYRLAYTRLWDADERMMRRRETLSGWTARPLRRPSPLGPIAELRQARATARSRQDRRAGRAPRGLGRQRGPARLG